RPGHQGTRSRPVGRRTADKPDFIQRGRGSRAGLRAGYCRYAAEYLAYQTIIRIRRLLRQLGPDDRRFHSHRLSIDRILCIMTDNPAPANSRKKLIIGSAAAVGIAAIALVVFV